MSRLKLIELGWDFLNRKISVNEFVSKIVIARRESYGSEEANKDIDHCAGELFIIADCFNPEPDRESYELDETGLRNKNITVSTLLRAGLYLAQSAGPEKVLKAIKENI